MNHSNTSSGDISVLAGKPAPQNLLIDVPKLIDAYYQEIPDPSIQGQRVTFGTSGHRGCSLETSFNEWHIFAICQAICLYRVQNKIDGPLFLGIDTHALSMPAFKSALQVLTANNVEVMIAENDEYTPTPVISHAILTYNRGRSNNLADGIVITPSHNPPRDGGFKYNPPSGGPADTEITKWIEEKANEFLRDHLHGINKISYEEARSSSNVHKHDYLNAYVNDLENVIDMEVIKKSNLKLAVDPLGGAGVHYWEPIAKKYGLNLTVINKVVDPTFSFMPVDWDGQIRMDPSSEYAMINVISRKDQFDIIFACDTDHDRHGIVTKNAGLLPSNHYLALAIYYLYQNRPQWNKSKAVGKTIVSSKMIDLVTASLKHKLDEVPVGFKWFVDGLLNGSLGFCGEESAGASMSRLSGEVWTTDKDGIILALLSAEIMATMKQDLSDIYHTLEDKFGKMFYQRENKKASSEEKNILKNLSAEQITSTMMAGEKIQTILTKAPGNDAPIDGLKVITENGWFAARPSGTEDIYKVYAESALSYEHMKQILLEADHIIKDVLKNNIKVNKYKNYYPATNLDGFELLSELALDLRWSWNRAADDIWNKIDPLLWRRERNPWSMLQVVSCDKLKAVLEDPETRMIIDNLVAHRRKLDVEPAWYQKTYPKSSCKHIAYFCMEFMLSEALPIYSGGLGNVAGDQLKAASDLGVPVVGIGLLYQEGYFHQLITKEGTQRALFPSNTFGRMPITPLRMADGSWLRIELDLPGCTIWLRTWQVQIGRTKLYLLDSNDMLNPPLYREITSSLYNGEPRTRLMQELVLGMGGWRLLQALNIDPQVCHLNEGHAAFVALERARGFMKKTNQPFAAALTATRAGNLFTTHTAVAAAFDRFDPVFIEQHLGKYAEQELGITCHDLLALGRENPNDENEYFNMGYLAMHTAGSVNAVSKLHERVSKNLFSPLFAQWPESEIPITHVTNGIHTPSWDSFESDQLWTDSCGKDRWLGEMKNICNDITKISDSDLWQFRMTSRRNLIQYARCQLSENLTVASELYDVIEMSKNIFNPNALTLGFARRFATYKRPDLLLYDTERLLRILCNPERPVQLIIAGKAHPADLPGQALIQKWILFIRRPEVREHIIFLKDDDIYLTEQLVQGVDVWLNMPRRPWEACGTSGMKILVNGGLNVSELDGWWAEAYAPELGWAIGDGEEHGDDPAWDAKDADTLYTLLENEVIPKFYMRDKDNIPIDWVRMMRESMSKLTAHYSANRAVRQYTEQHYLPSADAYLKRVDVDADIATQIVTWKESLKQKWHTLRLDQFSVEAQKQNYIFSIHVCFGDLDPTYLRVELYADKNYNLDYENVCIEMSKEKILTDSVILYKIEIPALRNASDYTVRIIPYHPEAAVPLEEEHILWQR